MINWLPSQADTRIIKENELIHQSFLQEFNTVEKLLSWFNSDKTYWRRKTLEKAEIFTGKKIHGTVMEIGAGTAWCSSLLSNIEEVKHIFTVEFDLFSIEKIMPNVFAALNADLSKIQKVHGFFDDIRLESNSLDFIFSMGALHHSQNLLKTYRELYRVLKPGGYVVISEPCYSNGIALEEEFSWRETEKSPGVRIKDNGDQLFRVCQYEAYALEAGFNPFVYTFDAESGKDIKKQIEDTKNGDTIFKNRELYEGFSKKIYYPYFAKGLTLEKIYNCEKNNTLKLVEHYKYDRCLVFLYKPDNCTYKSFSETVF